MSESTMSLENGNQVWLDVNGELHRTDGPAYIGADGSTAYYVNGQRHRTDGPAVIKADGTKKYWVNGQLHRTDGPAIIGADGTKEYWINGKRKRAPDTKEALQAKITKDLKHIQNLRKRLTKIGA